MRYRKQRLSKGNAISEFAPALVIMLIVVLFLFSMFSFAAGYATLAFSAFLGAREASSSGNTAVAVTNCNRIVNTVMKGGFGQFGGLKNPRITMFIEQAQPGDENFVPFNGSVDPDNLVYRYRIEAQADIQPLFVGDNLLGQRTIITGVKSDYSAVTEHPEGLDATKNGAVLTGS